VAAEASGGQVLRRRPNPRVAAVLSLIPGLGQLYNGQPRKAMLFLVSIVLTLGPAVLLITFGERFGHSLIDQHAFAFFLLVAFGSVLLFLVLFILGLYLWASAAADARRTAISIREGGVADETKVWFFRL
jgi:hypothetical protein